MVNHYVTSDWLAVLLVLIGLACLARLGYLIFKCKKQFWKRKNINCDVGLEGGFKK